MFYVVLDNVLLIRRAAACIIVGAIDRISDENHPQVDEDLSTYGRKGSQDDVTEYSSWQVKYWLVQ